MEKGVIFLQRLKTHAQVNAVALRVQQGINDENARLSWFRKLLKVTNRMHCKHTWSSSYNMTLKRISFCWQRLQCTAWRPFMVLMWERESGSTARQVGHTSCLRSIPRRAI